MISLHLRLSIALTLVISVFFAMTGVTIEEAYRHSLETAQEERLQAHTSTLIAATSPRPNGDIEFINEIPIPAFFTPGSGLYGQILGPDGKVVWLSPSSGDAPMIPLARMRLGQERLRIHPEARIPLAAYDLGVSWDTATANPRVFTFSVAVDLQTLAGRLSAFQQLLWGALLAVTIALLVVHALILRWGLGPLRRVADDLRKIENGDKDRLEGNYPRELRALTDNLNGLLRVEREHSTRYRHSLDDLAHSLKTPLAVIRTEMEGPHEAAAVNKLIGDQVDHIARQIDYQLRRAAGSGRTQLIGPVSVKDIAAKVIAALQKVYVEKRIDFTLEIDAGAVFHGDKDDLLEVLGNVLDNACIWCRQRVLITVHAVPDQRRRRAGLRIHIEDDGPGIDATIRDQIAERGASADPVHGHGIGLAMSREIIHLYGGTLKANTIATTGGTRVTLNFPGLD